MSVTPNLCCDETKNRGTYTRVTIPPTWTSPRFSTHHALSGCPLAFTHAAPLPGTLSWLPTFPVSFKRSKPNINSSSMRPFPASQAQHISMSLHHIWWVSYLEHSYQYTAASFPLPVLELLMFRNHVVFIFVIPALCLTPHRPLICVWLINGWIEGRLEGREKEKGRERNVALEIIGLCLLQKQYHQLLKPELFSETRKWVRGIYIHIIDDTFDIKKFLGDKNQQVTS